MWVCGNNISIFPVDVVKKNGVAVIAKNKMTRQSISQYIPGIAIGVFLVMYSLPAYATQNSSDLFDLSISDLSNVKISSVSKTWENAFKSAAAVDVLTDEHIQRSGATTIPELLRMLPGVEVAQISSNKWAITARGFNDQLANKLLVLIDGRTVYSPHFSGVYWDVQDVILEDIERIEAIRGPGGTLWGANAVNGVINIITKHAKNTQGNYASVGIGTIENGFAEFRNGGKIGDSAYYRAYGKVFDRDDSHTITGENAKDDWQMARGGFRLDWDKSPSEAVTLQGDIYQGKENEGRMLMFPALTSPFVDPTIDHEGGDVSSGNLLARWESTLSENSSIKLQSYIDNARRHYTELGTNTTTFDNEFQHIWRPDNRNEIVWGLGFRYISESIHTGQYFDHFNMNKDDTLYTAFLQDKFTLIPDNLYLTLGSKFEMNQYTDFEYQPTARFAWTPTDNQTLWGAVSRAVRTPNHAEDDFYTVVGALPPNTLAPNTPAGFVRWQGNPYLQSETMTAYELGYRIQPKENMLMSLVGFYNDFDDLVTNRMGSLFPDATTALAMPFENGAEGEVYGVEFSAQADITPVWRVTGSYSFVTLDLHLKPGSTDPRMESYEGTSPKNRFSLLSNWNITENVYMDNALYVVENLPGDNIPSYARFDTKLSWKPCDSQEYGVVGQNLLDNRHPEFSESLFATPTEVPRSVYGYMKWWF